ncbi:MAG: glycosyltransferase family 4 protein [Verrucomicrobiota bacterium]
MKIEFLIISPHKEKILDTAYPETTPVGGSETAALRMIDFFRSHGHEVKIITEGDQVRNNTCDIFIALRAWGSLIRGILPGKLNYLWCQDDANQPFFKNLEDPNLAQELWKHCDAVFMISHYQVGEWHRKLGLPHDKVFLTQNGITLKNFPILPHNLHQRKPRAYYASTPFRGLNVLLELWPLVVDLVPHAELDIMSSMGTYHEHAKDAPFEALFERARTMKGVRYQPGVGQAELRSIARECRVLAYPSIFPETGCIAAMEAMASGCAVVSTVLGALPETAWRNPLVPMEGDWMYAWAMEVARVLVDDDYYTDIARQNLDIAKWMDWEIIGQRWIRRFILDFSKKSIRVSPDLCYV